MRVEQVSITIEVATHRDDNVAPLALHLSQILQRALANEPEFAGLDGFMLFGMKQIQGPWRAQLQFLAYKKERT